jgi:DNA repair protein RecN (Recombination protein N)
VEERLELLHELKRKYGATIAEVLDSGRCAAEQLKEQSDTEGQLAEVERRLAEKTAELERTGNDLTARRQAAAQKLRALAEKEMADLGMAQTRFSVEVKPRCAPAEAASPADRATASGFDEVEFMIAPNVGEDLMPLRKIASGGEISRVMLALKSCLAEVDRMPVLVFDEVDANVGGRLGRVIGQKLAHIARSRQVICVTHLPQIACFAGRQVKVTKDVEGDRTFTRVAPLDGEARVDEIAEMIRGEHRTAVTRREAEDMLADAQRACGSLAADR